jgi:hypothetical protein
MTAQKYFAHSIHSSANVGAYQNIPAKKEELPPTAHILLRFYIFWFS